MLESGDALRPCEDEERVVSVRATEAGQLGGELAEDRSPLVVRIDGKHLENESGPRAHAHKAAVVVNAHNIVTPVLVEQVL